MALTDNIDVGRVARFVPLIAAAMAIGYVLGRRSGTQVNKSYNKDNPKVVHVCEIEDIGPNDKRAYCRCWRSGKFPLCDGTHAKHNEMTGDNVGPVVIKHK